MSPVPALARWDVKVHADTYPARTEQPLFWRAFIPVFHRWIQAGQPGGILVDVAEYTHIPHGPQVLLVGHEGIWTIDTTDGRPGMLYSQRRPPEGTKDPLTRALHECLKAVALLEAEPEAKGVLAFRTDRIDVAANDRNAAPNEPATYPGLEHLVTAVFEPLVGRVTLAREAAPRRRAGVTATAAARVPAADLLKKF